jgi:hypothetical protein
MGAQITDVTAVEGNIYYLNLVLLRGLSSCPTSVWSFHTKEDICASGLPPERTIVAGQFLHFFSHCHINTPRIGKNMILHLLTANLYHNAQYCLSITLLFARRCGYFWDQRREAFPASLFPASILEPPSPA